MLTNCLAACAHLTITVSEIERDIGRKSSFFHTPLHLTLPLRGFLSEHCHPVWHAKTRMAWLPDGEKISKLSLFVLVQLTNVMDGWTDGHWVTAYTALMHSIVRLKLWWYVNPFSSDTGTSRTNRRTELLYQYHASVCCRAIKITLTSSVTCAYNVVCIFHGGIGYLLVGNGSKFVRPKWMWPVSYRKSEI